MDGGGRVGADEEFVEHRQPGGGGRAAKILQRRPSVDVAEVQGGHHRAGGWGNGQGAVRVGDRGNAAGTAN